MPEKALCPDGKRREALFAPIKGRYVCVGNKRVYGTLDNTDIFCPLDNDPNRDLIIIRT